MPRPRTPRPGRAGRGAARTRLPVVDEVSAGGLVVDRVPASTGGANRARTGRRDPRAWPGRMLGWAAGLALAVAPATAAWGSAATPPPDDGEPSAAVRLDSISPASGRPGTVVTLAGSISNTGPDPLESVQVLLRYSRDGLEERAEIARVADDPDFRLGRRDSRYFQQVADMLAPGATAAYRLDVPLDALGLGDTGVYVLGVDVRASTESGRHTVGTARTLLPWLAGTTPEPVDVTVIWPLTSAPALLRDGSLAGGTAAGDVAAGGRIDQLVRLADGHVLTWAVDPDLVDTVSTLADRQEWLAALGSTLTGADAFALPYASLDVAAVTDASADPDGSGDGPVGSASALVTRAVVMQSRAAQVLGVPVRTGIVWPAGGAAGADALAAARTAGASAVILSADAVTPAPGDAAGAEAAAGPVVRVAAGATGSAELPGVLLDPGLDRIWEYASDGEASPALARQSFTSYALLAAIEGSGPLVTAPPERWTPGIPATTALLNGLRDTPWLTPRTLTTLLTGYVAQLPSGIAGLPRYVPAYGQDERDAQLDAGFLEAFERAAGVTDSLAVTIGDPSVSLRTGSLEALRGLSAAWRDDPSAGRAYLDSVADAARRALGRVTVQVPDTVTLSSRDGRFPLTVSNELDREVVVRLAVSPVNPDRMTVDPIPEIRVAAGERASVLVAATATTNGRIPVAVRLVSPEGEPIGPARSMVVVATEYGTIGWVVVGAGVLLLLVATAIRVRRLRVRRGSLPDGTGGTGGTPGTPEPPGSPETPEDPAVRVPEEVP